MVWRRSATTRFASAGTMATLRACTPGITCESSPTESPPRFDRSRALPSSPRVRPVPDRPQMTVAIPTCNGARHLAVALRGILAQEGVEFELVVSDDRSEDESLAIVRAEAGDRARVFVNGERLGLAGNWNRCLAIAT